MKKIVSLVLLVVMAATLVIPAAAEEHVEWVRLIYVTDDAEIDQGFGQPITEAEMLAAVAEDEEIFPNSSAYKYMSVLCQRRIRCREELVDLGLRVWGSRNQVALLFFKGVGENTWTLVGRNIGEVIDVCMPGNGEYAVAYAS